ncbi:DUF1573 domain-containing protein [Clostridium sp.]|uniref:DUF1573 domain-containing protein n=1 Tax=Clostridium sp. TaxID=1506 RepID=UPI002FCADE23
MKDLIFDEFQNAVDSCLLRHKSILDIMTKLQESQARVNRAVIKSVTSCGCLKVDAKKQCIHENIDNIDLDDINDSFDTHLTGKLCDNCREVIEREMGNNFFYMTSLCNTLDINLYDVFLKEYKRITTFDKLNNFR